MSARNHVSDLTWLPLKRLQESGQNNGPFHPHFDRPLNH